MSKRTRVTLIAFVLCAVLVVSACGGGNNNNGNNPANTPDNSGSAPSTSAPAEEDLMGKYDPPIEIELVGVTDDSIENLFTKLPGESFEDNRWTKLYEDTLGITFKYNWIAKGADQYKQKMNVSLVSGDVPELIAVDSTELKKLYEADLIMDLGELYDKYASPLTKQVLEGDDFASFKAATIDGKMMALPNMTSSSDRSQFLWLRTDWLEKLNIPEPKTMQDVLAIIEAFATQDPDGNGKADTVGLLLQKDLFGGFAALEGFFNSYHAYPNVWVEDGSGNLVYGNVLPEMKTALAELQQMYKKGLLDREFGVKDGGKVAETSSAGKAGVSFGEQWLNAWPFQINHDNDPNAMWKAYPLMSIDDKEVQPQMTLGTWKYWAVRKDAKNPEALIKMFNMYIEKNWGETSEFGTYYLPGDAEGTWKLSPVTPEPPTKNLDAFLAIEEAVNNGTTDALTGEAKVIFEKITEYKNGNEKLWSWDAGYGTEGVFGVMKEYVNSNRLLMNGFLGAPTPTMVEKSATLGKLTLETFTRIILGDLPVDAFDKYVEDWNNLGGQQMTAEVNEWHKAN